jgi:hypothetical protein
MGGLLASSVTILVFFLIWSFLLLMFKCLAPSNSSNATRWLTGKQLYIDEPPNPDSMPFTVKHSEWQRHYQNIKIQLYSLRAVVLFSGISIVISAIVMSIGGTNSLTQTLSSARQSIGLVLVHGLATDAIHIGYR